MKKLITLIALLPLLSFGQGLRDKDKQLHFTASALATVTSATLIDNTRLSDTWKTVLKVAVPLSLGTLKEVTDVWRGAEFDAYDIRANFQGVVFGIVLYEPYKALKDKNKLKL